MGKIKWREKNLPPFVNRVLISGVCLFLGKITDNRNFKLAALKSLDDAYDPKDENSEVAEQSDDPADDRHDC